MKQLLEFSVTQNTLGQLWCIDLHHGIRKINIKHDDFFMADGAVINQRIIDAFGLVDFALGI